MQVKSFIKTLKVAAFGAAVIFGLSAKSAFADNIQVTYLAPGVQVPTATPFYETFDNWTSTTNTTDFNGSGVIGTYSGTYRIVGANAFGGANNSPYITTVGEGSDISYTVSLSQPVNYFGLWFSALDSGNQLAFYDGNSLVGSFSPSQYTQLVGICPGPSAYCANPNNGLNDGQQYAYLNFFDTNGSFNRIVFTENPATGGEFEADNEAISYLSKEPVGTPLTPVTGVTPEPSTLMLAFTGLAGLMFLQTSRGRV